MHPKRILLTTAPRPKRSPMHFADNRPPQGLGVLYQMLVDHGHEALVVDPFTFPNYKCDVGSNAVQEDSQPDYAVDVFAAIREFAPDFVGIHVTSLTFQSALMLARTIRREFNDIKLICGGPHPTIFPRDFEPTFDYIVCGEGERAIVEIANGDLKPGIINIEGREFVNIRDVPWFDYSIFIDKPYNWRLDIFDNDDYPVLPLNTSRGCPFSCSFCSVRSIYDRYRYIPAIRICERMEELNVKFGATTFYFREDCFTGDLPRLRQFCDTIIGRKYGFKWVCESRVAELTPLVLERMARAGCVGMYVGCESGSDSVLKLINKKETVADYREKFPIINELGISIYSTWMYGIPGETRMDRRRTKMLIEELKPYMSSYDEFVYIGIPKSVIYRKLDKLKLYECKDQAGIIYPRGYLALASLVYGEGDSRVRYVRDLYRDLSIEAEDVKW